MKFDYTTTNKGLLMKNALIVLYCARELHKIASQESVKHNILPNYKTSFYKLSMM
jgi:hypothetical protein